MEALSKAPTCGIQHLGRYGIKNINGLQIAFIEGTYNAAAYCCEKDTSLVDQSHSFRYYTSEDVKALKQEVTAAEGDVDIFLSNDWPENILNLIPVENLSSLKSQNELKGNGPCSEIAVITRPRYHFAAGHNLFYARLPYLNPDIGTGSHATRFISLGEVGNADKQKWLHALQLVPASEMTEESLKSVPPGTTESPYEYKGAGVKRGAELNGDANMGEQSWRWTDRSKRQRSGPIAAPSFGRKDIEKDRSKSIFVRNVPFQATEDELVAFFSRSGPVIDIVRKTHGDGKLNTFCHVQFATKEAMESACQLNGVELMGRELYIAPAREEKPKEKGGEAVPVEGCWFCLSNPNADVQLVASINEESYLALDKGAITNRHILVVPVEHHASSLDAPLSTWQEMERYMSSLKSCFASEGKTLVGFERYMRLRKSGGNHCHINVIAVPLEIAKNSRQVFEDSALKHGFHFTYLPPEESFGDKGREALSTIVGNKEYFLAFLPDGSRLVHPIAYGEKHPLNFGREVLSKLAGVPERADWKACKYSDEEEVALTENFKSAFKRWDIMQES